MGVNSGCYSETKKIRFKENNKWVFVVYIYSSIWFVLWYECEAVYVQLDYNLNC